MAKALVIGSLAWPLLLGVATWQAASGPSGWAAMIYGVGSVICHQRPERSFHTAGTKWPVCARCAGLYLSAPIGAAMAFVWSRRATRRRAARRSQIGWLALASVPTAATLALEWTGVVAVGNLARALAALPLGAAIAAVLVTEASMAARPNDARRAEAG